MKKLKPNIVGLSLGITSAVLYILCLMLVWITPVSMMTPFVNNLFHSMDFTGMMAKSITISGSIIGIAAWFFISWAAGFIFALVYNGISEK